MNYAGIKALACLLIVSLLAFNVHAAGLHEYLQNSESAESPTKILTSANAIENVIANSSTTNPPSIIVTQNDTSEQLKNIIELVVAGIVASALIIVVLVLFLGRWLASREKRLIKELRMEAEQDKEHITSATTTIREQEKETTRLTQNIRNQATEFSTQQKVAEKFSKDIIEASEVVKQREEDIDSITDQLSGNMNEIRSYWSEQVDETVSTMQQFHRNLNENINLASDNLEKMDQQKSISQELLQDFLDKHNEQSNILEHNSEMSQRVSQNLQRIHDESESLLDTLSKHKQTAESSLSHYSQRLNSFEEQAYEQFDTSFQVADLARQELAANLEENRKHIETIRRQEEQSHGITSQITKNLETLDYSKIIKISKTLDTTQDMFEEIHHKVEETRQMLEDLKQIEIDIKQTASNVEHTIGKDDSEQDLTADNQFYADEMEEISAEIRQNNTVQEEDIVTEDMTGNDLIEEIEHIQEELHDIVEETALETPNDSLLDVPKSVTRDNTTIAITDYKMASGDNSTPLSFFRQIKESKK